MGESKRRAEAELRLVAEKDDPRSNAQRFCRGLIKEFCDGPEVLIKSHYEWVSSALGWRSAGDIIRETREMFEEAAMQKWTNKLWDRRLSKHQHAELCKTWKKWEEQGPSIPSSMMCRMGLGIDSADLDLEVFGAKLWPTLVRGTWRFEMHKFCRKKISEIELGERGQELTGLLWLRMVMQFDEKEQDEFILECLKAGAMRAH
jgi:hypothetical protein